MPLNLPNLLTWLRITLIPLAVGVFYLGGGWLSVHEKNLVATVLFVVAAVTDWLDGWIGIRGTFFAGAEHSRDGRGRAGFVAIHLDERFGREHAAGYLEPGIAQHAHATARDARIGIEDRDHRPLQPRR